jgi:hypothetical protein
LVPKSEVAVSVDIGGEAMPIDIACEGGFDPAQLKPQPEASAEVATDTTVPLVRLAWARSGDKGDHSNIGVIAREAEFVPYIQAALTEEAVAEWMTHTLNPETGKVTRWSLPGLNAFNFLLEHSLGGGGIASLRIDPQGKAFAQQLLEFPVPVPSKLFES